MFQNGAGSWRQDDEVFGAGKFIGTLADHNCQQSAWTKRVVWHSFHKVMGIARTKGRQVITVILVLGCVACIVTILTMAWLARKAPRVSLTETAPAVDVTLAPGKAVVLLLPRDRELAVWNEKAGRFGPRLTLDKASMGYGEKPFRQLDRFEQVELPGGGTTSGRSFSYIRPGPVMDGGMDKPREYILFVDDFRISLKQTALMPVMRLRVTMEKASEHEKLGPKGEIDHFLGLLKSKDPAIRSTGVSNLAELLIAGSTYGELRQGEIIRALQVLADDPDAGVRGQASAKLCEAGDPVSILKEIETRARETVTDAEAAWSLGRWMRYPANEGSVESVYQRAVELAGSSRESERVLGVAFLGGCPEHAAAGPAIRRALDDPSAKVRAAAARGLEQVFGSNKVAAREQSVSMLADSSPDVLIEVLESSIYVGQERELPLEVVAPFLDHGNRRLRIAAIRALRFANGSAVERRLLPITREQDAEIRAEAAEALAGGTLPETIQRFVEMLDDTDDLVRIRGIQGLTNGRTLHRPDAIQERLRKETDPDVIRVAKDALKMTE